MATSQILSNLNKEQLEAVTHKNGPLLIIAGAGTGKTTVITRRIAYLIEQKLAKPSEILALTFTEKAAAEMEERVDLLVPYGFTDIWISTFHAFGDRLLRDYALDLGLPTNFKVLSKIEQAIFMRQHLFSFDLKQYRPIASPTSHIDNLLTHFNRLKDELITPEEYLQSVYKQISSKTRGSDDLVDGEKQLELAKAYQHYQELMIQSGNLDYGDQIFLTYKLLIENSKILQEISQKFKYILVDEYQDTNYAQNEIVKLLAKNHQNITVVGDDDQSIYRFRGASISNILSFKKDYKKITQIVLNENFRSTQEILQASYRLIINNNPDRLEYQNQINKKLTSKRKGIEPKLLFTETLSLEADLVVKKIKELKDSGLNNNQIAILVRANSQAKPFIQALNMAGVPYIFSGSGSLYDYPEVKMLVAFLKTLVFTDDSLTFHQLASSELYGVSSEILAEIYTKSKRLNRNILSLINNQSDPLLKKVKNDIEKFRLRVGDQVGELLYDYLTEKRYLKKLSAELTIENELKISRVAKFFDQISNFVHASSEQGVIAFLDSLELILEVENENGGTEIDPDLQAVNILTVHAAKGLEYEAVFLVNCVTDRFPLRNRRDPFIIPNELIKEKLPEGDFHLQEERRLFYVALTRAKSYLYLSAAEDYGGKRAKKLSIFVLETLSENQPEKLKNQLSPTERINRFKKNITIQTGLPAKFQGEIIRLSRQQIDDYITCPKKFYYAHIIKIPLLANQNLMYGTAIHSALDRHFNRKIRGEKTTLKLLQNDFKEAFDNIGFISREHEDLRLKQGLETLHLFYQVDQNYPRIPLSTEERFEFAEKDIKINGRYDLVFKEGDKFEICDFKTSDIKKQTDADRRIKESTQMKIYALAWAEKHNTIPKTTLYFLESGLKGETLYTEKDLEDTRTMILKANEGIRSNQMPAKPNYLQCRWCPYRDLCPEAE